MIKFTLDFDYLYKISYMAVAKYFYSAEMVPEYKLGHALSFFFFVFLGCSEWLADGLLLSYREPTPAQTIMTSVIWAHAT